MLTREQKIDFLKCAIAAYEHPILSQIADRDEMTTGEIKLYIDGICSMFQAWCKFKFGSHDSSLNNEFPCFWSYLVQNRTISGDYYFNNSKERAQICKQYLKTFC